MNSHSRLLPPKVEKYNNLEFLTSPRFNQSCENPLFPLKPLLPIGISNHDNQSSSSSDAKVHPFGSTVLIPIGLLLLLNYFILSRWIKFIILS